MPFGAPADPFSTRRFACLLAWLFACLASRNHTEWGTKSSEDVSSLSVVPLASFRRSTSEKRDRCPCARFLCSDFAEQYFGLSPRRRCGPATWHREHVLQDRVGQAILARMVGQGYCFGATRQTARARRMPRAPRMPKRRWCHCAQSSDMKQVCVPAKSVMRVKATLVPLRPGIRHQPKWCPNLGIWVSWVGPGGFPEGSRGGPGGVPRGPV